MTFKEIYDSTENRIKTEFLFKLLEKDTKLRRAFLQSIPPVDTENSNILLNYDDFTEEIKRAYNDYSGLMNTIDLEWLDWENYVPPHSGYVEEWEAYEALAEQEINDTFGGIEDEILKNLLQGKISLVITDLLAFRLAAEDSDINDPNNCLDDDVAGYLIDYKLKEWTEFTIKKLSDTRFSDDEAINSLKLFFRYIEENGPAEAIRDFELLLLKLVNLVTDKQKLPRKNDLTNIKDSYFPKLASTLTKYTDSDNWEDTALNLMFEEPSVAEDLLNRYLDTGKKQKYIDTAKRLFRHNSYHWAMVIVKNIKPEDDRQLFVDVNLKCCTQNRDIKYYVKIKDILSEKEKNNLLKDVERNKLLSAEILREEGEYDKIKDIVRKLPGSWDFSKRILNTIKDVYPDFAFDMIKLHIDKKMEEKRNRSLYESIAEWLVYAGNLKGQKDKANELATEWYNHKPNLPALKDEFRKAGLM